MNSDLYTPRLSYFFPECEAAIMLPASRRARPSLARPWEGEGLWIFSLIFGALLMYLTDAHDDVASAVSGWAKQPRILIPSTRVA
jgi:hypothetical protein